MKIFNSVLWISISIITFCFVMPVLSESETKKIKIETYQDAILFAGYGYQDEFDSSLIKDDTSKKIALEKGLEIFEEMSRDGSSIHQEALASYYIGKKDFKKGLYWASRCSEQGSSKGMYFLYDAYMYGEGVVKDVEEGLKWLFLAAAAGDEYSIGRLAVLKNKIDDFDSCEWIQQCKKNAQDWIKEHPKAFFNPD